MRPRLSLVTRNQLHVQVVPADTSLRVEQLRLSFNRRRSDEAY